MTQREFEAGPSKRFFVEMLPRDISLEHAVLDLVDNSVDGAIRLRIAELQLRKPSPYKGLCCRLNITGDTFEISDNCGGIPKDRIDAALRLGREDTELDNDKPTIGVYGIGMKRSIFKISADASVYSNNETAAIRVNYDKAWLDPTNNDWTLIIDEADADSGDKGVTITANELRPSIANTFSSKAFIDDLVSSLARYYAYIIEKGFSISVNGIEITALPVDFKFSDEVQPFYYENSEGGVVTKVLVGLFRNLTKEDERENAIQSPGVVEAGSQRAGITVVCNDRVVTYADTTSVTGWGVGNVPRYHPQFRSIVGLMIFETDDARNLPVSTTKGALDMDEAVYVQAKNAAMEALRSFTSYTNRVKGREQETDQLINHAQSFSVAQVVEAVAPNARAVRNSDGKSKKSLPKLPEPVKSDPMSRISFARERSEVQQMAELLGLPDDQKPGEIGEHVWEIHARNLKVID